MKTNTYTMNTRLLLIILYMFVAHGCTEALEFSHENEACEEIGQAIAYQTFVCEGDGELANARYHTYLDGFMCAPLSQERADDHYACTDAILSVDCDETKRLGDDFDAWLSTDPSCTSSVSTASQASCSDIFTILENELAGLVTFCAAQDASLSAGFQPDLTVIEPLRNGDFACRPGLTQDPEERGRAIQSCVDVIRDFCPEVPALFSTDAWLSAPECAALVERVETTSSQVCAEIGETLFYAYSTCGRSSEEQNGLRNDFINRSLCPVALQEPNQLDRHLTCLNDIRRRSCIDVNAFADGENNATDAQAFLGFALECLKEVQFD